MFENKLNIVLTLVLVLMMGLFFTWVADAAEKSPPSFFEKSLHFTGEGMRYWYEENNGFKEITGIPYEKLGCKGCHAKTCDACHQVKIGETFEYSVEKSKSLDTCLNCHERTGAAFKFAEAKKAVDVHLAKGMTCASCHKGKDVHGDGTFYNSMRSPKVLKVSCAGCHTAQREIRAHTVHQEKLDCAACHVKDSMSCMNCHFDTFMKTESRAGNFFPALDWLLLMNYEGKVTSATAMSLVYQNKKFIAYTPYFTHVIQKEGRQCPECHGNEAIKLLKDGKAVPMMTYKEGKVEMWKGVDPLVPDKLEWAFLNKVGEKSWQPIEGGKVDVQIAGFGEPLTEEQIKKLAMPEK